MSYFFGSNTILLHDATIVPRTTLKHTYIAIPWGLYNLLHLELYQVLYTEHVDEPVDFFEIRVWDLIRAHIYLYFTFSLLSQKYNVMYGLICFEKDVKTQSVYKTFMYILSIKQTITTQQQKTF